VLHDREESYLITEGALGVELVYCDPEKRVTGFSEKIMPRQKDRAG
jgi:hypothetical protein